MKNFLIIIDPQYDFIDGSLAVNNADSAMNNLAEFIKNTEDLEQICITLDWHPGTHVSFKDFGGQWPSHCVQYTKGAAIYDSIFNVLKEKKINTNIYLKGMDYRLDEYSFVQALTGSTIGALLTFIKDNYDKVYVAGIAGDVCVLNTLKDIAALNPKITVLKDCVASIDGGEALNNYIKENNLNVE